MLTRSENEIIFDCVERKYVKHVDAFGYKIQMRIKYQIAKLGGFITFSNEIYAENLINEEFLKSNNIEYFIEDNKVIPIGIVSFINIFGQDKYSKNSLSLILLDTQHNDSLCKNQLALKNIERAIELRFGEYKLLESCNIEEY